MKLTLYAYKMFYFDMIVVGDSFGRQPNPSARGARGQYHSPKSTKQDSGVC